MKTLGVISFLLMCCALVFDEPGDWARTLVFGFLWFAFTAAAAYRS